MRHPQPRSLISLGTMDSGNWFRGKKIERKVLEILGPWPHMLEMLVLKWLKHLSANFRDIPAHFRDKIYVFFLVSTKKCSKPVFNPSWEFSSDISPNIWGIAFFISSAQLTYLKVLEKAAEVCEEPENPWNDKTCDISIF